MLLSGSHFPPPALQTAHSAGAHLSSLGHRAGTPWLGGHAPLPVQLRHAGEVERDEPWRELAWTGLALEAYDMMENNEVKE